MLKTKTTQVLNSYEKIIQEYGITEERFYEVGIKMCLFAPRDEAERDWRELKEQFVSGKKSGMKMRMVVHEYWLRRFYYDLFRLELAKDRDGNLTPNETLCELLGIRKPANYVCVHIFGGTNNPLLFNALFNVCYIPSIYAPLTINNRHKMTPLHAEFRKRFLAEVYRLYSGIIDDYNDFLHEQRVMEKIEHDLINPEIYPKRFIANIKEQWLPLTTEA